MTDHPAPGVDLGQVLAALEARLTDAHPDTTGRGRRAATQRLPARTAETAELPAELPDLLASRLAQRGIATLWRHQAEALAHVRAGRHVAVATPTASGKSLCYQLPIAWALLDDPDATALYLAPTKALAADQVAALRSWRLPQLRVARYDGDTPRREREAVRRTANVIATNPDMLHHGILGGHRQWSPFLAGLAVVVIDEAHVARGVFGTHVAAILRRLRRLCARYGADPVVVCTSATIANPGEHATALTGLDVAQVVRDGAPHPPVGITLWEPPLVDADAGARRSALAEATDVTAALAGTATPTLAFVRSRKGAELLAAATSRQLDGAGSGGRVAVYRAGLLPEERRAVERGLIDGDLLAVAATDALELGVDVGTLDAVVITGWPGTTASFWQQAGRAGRRDRPAEVVWVAGDDPLDRWWLTHPEALWAAPVEAATIDVTNPHILGPHLRCAAWEQPLDPDEPWFAPADLPVALDAEAEAGHLRERGGRWYPTARTNPAAAIGIRSTGGTPVVIVEAATGAVIGDVDASRAHRTVHTGAIYLHQGRQWRILRLDLDAGVAEAARDDGDVYTVPRSDTDVAILATEATTRWGRCALSLGRVEVSTRVLAYERRRAFTDTSLGVVDLELPPEVLVTRALWLAIPDEVVAAGGITPAAIPGAAHAAEHAAIGLLGLFAMCDRWDIGGVSTARHADTGMATIVIYDGHPGGAGIADRGFATDDSLWRTTMESVRSCPCTTGCPSCVQSPKCGNGNEPLDKAAAVDLLAAALAERGR